MYNPKDLKPGDAILVKGNSILSAAIRFATVNPYTHALIVGNGCLLESSWVIEQSPLDKYATTGDVFTIDATDAQKVLAIEWMEKHIGQAYGIAAILEDGARDLAHIPIWPRLNPRSVTCSGAVAMAYLKSGVVLTYACLPSPADLSYSPLLIGKRPWDRG